MSRKPRTAIPASVPAIPPTIAPVLVPPEEPAEEVDVGDTEGAVVNEIPGSTWVTREGTTWPEVGD